MDLTFRFPIALLAYEPESPLLTLSLIVDWCVYEAGLARIGKVATYGLARRFVFEVEREAGCRYQPENFGECVACLGAAMLEVPYDRIRGVAESHARMREFLVNQDEASVRNTANMKTHWVWACRKALTGEGDWKGKPLSWREFRVLAAILSKMGKKSHVPCGWKEIQARAAGWCGKQALRASEGWERGRRRPLRLTRDMIRHTLDRLEMDFFFARFRYARCQTWFSFSCGQNRAELANWVTQTKTRRRRLLAANAADDQAVTERIRAVFAGSRSRGDRARERHVLHSSPEPAMETVVTCP